MAVSNRPIGWQSILAHAATAISTVLLAWVAAYWTWHWVAPTAVPAAEPVAPLPSASAADWFGKPQKNQEILRRPVGLLGVVAPSASGKGYAIVRIGEQPAQSVKEGEAFAPGLKLFAIKPDSVTIDRGGTLETLSLPENRFSPGNTSTPGK